MNVQRIFGCGIDRRLFNRKYEALSKEDQERLERVARRVHLTLKLRYEMGFRDNPLGSTGEGYILRDVELPSIEVYLLCTCLDTLAGKPTYKCFDKWITQQPDVTAVDRKGIVNLVDRYKEEYGVGSNFRRLFTNLSDGTKDWLANNVAIRRSGQPLEPEMQDVDRLVERLCRYFYDIRRNRFTHGSVSLHTPIAQDIRQAGAEGWWITPASGAGFILHPKKPSQKWDLSYREGLDEATILRIIIHAAALHILKIEITAGLVDVNLRNYSRMDALYAFVSEVNRNSALVNPWGDLDHPALGELRSYLFHVGVPQVSSEAAKRMVGRYLDNTFESGLREMTSQYLRQVDDVNCAIRHFNEANPPRTKGQDAGQRCHLITEFLDGLVETPACMSVARWPSITEMTNLWLVIRDPCYT
jgi:hypothetical protein